MQTFSFSSRLVGSMRNNIQRRNPTSLVHFSLSFFFFFFLSLFSFFFFFLFFLFFSIFFLFCFLSFYLFFLVSICDFFLCRPTVPGVAWLLTATYKTKRIYRIITTITPITMILVLTTVRTAVSGVATTSSMIKKKLSLWGGRSQRGPLFLLSPVAHCLSAV